MYSLTVITFTAEEAVKIITVKSGGNIPEVLQKAGIKDYQIVEYKPSSLDKFKNFVLNPEVQGILKIVMIGGI
jgi:membrane-bound serine protease (ClpP class)